MTEVVFPRVHVQQIVDTLALQYLYRVYLTAIIYYMNTWTLVP